MSEPPSLALILAAGKGTRMESARPKVLHAVAGAPMLEHVLRAAVAAGFSHRAVVLAADAQAEAAPHCRRIDPDCEIIIQVEQLGTAHAVLAARPILERLAGELVVLFGDTPLLRVETLEAMRRPLRAGAAVAVLGFEAADPSGYGRLILDGAGALAAIREEQDASEDERAVRLCNGGVMGFAAGLALGLLDRVGRDNAKGEYYLTDTIAIARRDGLAVAVVTGSEEDVLGINSRAQLARAEAVMQQRLRSRAMRDGATLIAPETVFLSHDTRLGRDVTVEPHVVIGPGVTIEDDATVRAFSHLESAHVGVGAIVGPYARLRPGAHIGRGAHVGNFVEIKNARLEEGAKANHLSYIGDAHVGPAANVGAGTITCNFDGFAKHRTEIGAGAFIGSNTALVAPVKVGDGAYIGSGSVITKDVPSDALALTRAPLEQRQGWAGKMRMRRKREKERGEA